MSDISTSPSQFEREGPKQDVGDQAKVYAARMRLQNALDQADALDAIREIAGNLIGTEEVAVFKVDKKRSELWLIGLLASILTSIPFLRWPASPNSSRFSAASLCSGYCCPRKICFPLTIR